MPKLELNNLFMTFCRYVGYSGWALSKVPNSNVVSQLPLNFDIRITVWVDFHAGLKIIFPC